MMKAKNENLVVEVWKINREDLEGNYEPWLREAIEKKLVGWSNEMSDGGGNLSGVLWRKYLKGKKLASPYLWEKDSPLANRFVVTSYGPFPTVGFVGDYLVYSEQFPEKYRIISEKTFEKQFQLV